MLYNGSAPSLPTRNAPRWVPKVGRFYALPSPPFPFSAHCLELEVGALLPELCILVLHLGLGATIHTPFPRSTQGWGSTIHVLLSCLAPKAGVLLSTFDT